MGGEAVTVGAAVEQNAAQGSLERANSARHRGVVDTQGARRAGQAAGPGQRQEIAHVLPVKRLCAVFISHGANLVYFRSWPPLTLLQIAGASPRPANLADSVLVIVDAQNEYVSGKLPLTRIAEAIAENARLLAAARAAGTPVIHIVQHSPPGRPVFDPQTKFAEIVPELTPLPVEEVIAKKLPNGCGSALGHGDAPCVEPTLSCHMAPSQGQR